MAFASCAPSGFISTSPVLAKLIGAPEAPASTAHAAHVFAQTYSAPLTYAAPFGYNAFATAPLAAPLAYAPLEYSVSLYFY